MLKGGEYALTEGDFIVTQQLLEYNAQQKENDDDVIDTGAYGPQMIREYYFEIMDAISGTEHLQHKAQSSYEIARI